MPKSDHILFLPGFSIKKTVNANPLVIEATYKRKPQCPHCHSKRLRIKDSFMRQVRHESIGERSVLIRFKSHKYRCYQCKRYFNQRYEGLLPHQRATERLKAQVFQQHTLGVAKSDLAHYFRLGEATVERWYQRYYQRKNQHIQNRHWPSVLGIDEHSFKKRQFATTFCDFRKHKVFDIAQGKSASKFIHSLLPIPGRERVKVVCIDLCQSYRSFVKGFFPNALIVADRFHVVRLVEHAFMQTAKAIIPEIKYQRGTIALLRTKPENLSAKQSTQLELLLSQQPAIKALHEFKLSLVELLKHKHQNAKSCRQLIPIFLSFIKQLKGAVFEPLIRLGKTLYKWRDEIVRMWRFTKNNGITEGFHRKMKLIQRRAYGFRNFENYRLRVRVLCS